MMVFTWRLQPHPNWRVFLVAGVLGGYTTFSAFEYETYLAVRGGDLGIALLNLSASVITGYLALCLGVWLAKSALH
jgi:fluoride exporter